MWNWVTRSRVFWAVVALRFLSLIPAVIDEDEAWFSASARVLSSPFQYFERAVDNKPPGTVIFYWLCGGDLRVTRAVMIALATLTALLLGRIAARLGMGEREEANGSPTNWRLNWPINWPMNWNVALLFIVCSVIPSFELFSVTNEGLLLFFEALCLNFFLDSSRLSLFASALAFGLSLLIKPTALFFLIPLAVLWPSLNGGKRNLGDAFLWMGTAILVPVVLAVGFGIHEFWYWTVVYPAEILTQARSTLFQSSREFVSNFLRFALFLLPLIIVALRELQRSGPLRGFICAWLFSGAVAVAMGNGLFLHYFLLVLPPLCFVASQAEFWTGWKKIWLGVLYVASCLVIAIPGFANFWGLDLHYHETLSQSVSQLTAPHDKVFIWGGSAIPLAMSGRAHSTAFATARFLVPPYTTAEIQKGFEGTLMSDKPALILDLSERGDNRFNFPVSFLPFFDGVLRTDYLVADNPALPWVHFYFLKERFHKAPEGFVAPLSPGSESDYLAEWQKSWASRPSGAGVEWALREDGILRTDWALERLPLARDDRLRQEWSQIRMRGVATPFSVIQKFQSKVLERYHMNGFQDPYALSSPLAWVGYSIVHLQPVTLPRVTEAAGTRNH